MNKILNICLFYPKENPPEYSAATRYSDGSAGFPSYRVWGSGPQFLQDIHDRVQLDINGFIRSLRDEQGQRIREGPADDHGREA